MATGTGSVRILVPDVSGTADNPSFLGDISGFAAPSVNAIGYTGSAIGAGQGFPIPVPIVNGFLNNVGCSAPLPTINAKGLQGSVGVADIQQTTPSINSRLLTGITGLGDITAPYPVVFGSSGKYGAITTPLVDVSGIGKTGQYGYAYPNVPVVTLKATGYQTSNIVGSISAPVIKINATGIQKAVIAGSVLAPSLDVSGTGVIGHVSSAIIEIPVVTINASGYLDSIGTASVYIPVPTISATGIVSVAAGVIFGVVINTRNESVTEYQGLNINSMCNFAGYTLAATDQGIVAFTGTDDQGVPIAQTVTGASHDFDTSLLKKITAGYVSCRLSGDVLVTLSRDSGDVREYTLKPRSQYTHVAKVKFGLGVFGNRWQWGLKSDSSTFRISSMTFDVGQSSTRRIR